MKVTDIGRTLFLSLLVLLLLGTSNALSACDGDTVSASFNFINNKGTTQHYNIQKSGTPSSWTTITPATFVLESTQSKLVSAFIKVPYGTPSGVYSLRFSANSESDIQSQTLDINVLSCHTITASFSNDSVNACLNQEVSVPLTIKNTGKFVETINLTASVGLLSQSSVTLGVNDSQTVNVVVTPRTIGETSVNVTLLYTNGSSVSTVSINTNECVFFNASVSSTYINMCENENKLVTLNLQNGPGSRVYYFNTSSFLIDVPSSVTLSPNEKYSKDFTVYSGCSGGVFNSSINVWTPGSRVMSVPLVLNLRDCFKPIVTVSKENDESCACENVSYKFTVFNPGSKALTYSLSSSVGTVLLNGTPVSSVDIPVDGSVDLEIIHNVTCSYSGDLQVSLNATAVHVCAKSSVAGVNVKVNSWGACESVSLTSPSNVFVNESDVVVPVSVSNIGLRPASYNILVTGSALSNLLGISKSFVTLNPGESEVVELTFSPSKITGNYINVQAFSTDNLARASTTFNFGEFAIGTAFYYSLIGVASGIFVFLIISRGKIFKKDKTINSNGKDKVAKK